jgi:hypothetical protein
MKGLHLTLAIVVLVATSITNRVYSQSSVRDLEKYMSQLRKSPYESMPESILKDVKAEQELIDALIPFLSDTTPVVRQKAFYITRRVGQKSKDNQVQQKCIEQIVKLIRDRDSGVSGNAIEALTGFTKNNFSNSAKDSVRHALHPSTSHLDQLLKLAGFLELQDQVPTIQSMLQSDLSSKDKWAARLSLARMGDESATSWIVTKLQSAKVNDDFTYDIVPDLVYTRQPAVFEYLETVINSDDENCQSSNPDSSKKMLCGYRVMESVAAYIKGFPVKTDESGDLLAKDYKQALKDVRVWFAANPQYTISTDLF